MIIVLSLENYFWNSEFPRTSLAAENALYIWDGHKPLHCEHTENKNKHMKPHVSHTEWEIKSQSQY